MRGNSVQQISSRRKLAIPSQFKLLQYPFMGRRFAIHKNALLRTTLQPYVRAWGPPQTKTEPKPKRRKPTKPNRAEPNRRKTDMEILTIIDNFTIFLCFSSFGIILLSGINYFLSGYMKYIYICTIFFVILIITLSFQCLI